MLQKLTNRVFFLTIALCFFCRGGYAQTQQQIEQFKRLPKAQQEALAKQLGIDLSQLAVSQQSSTAQQPATEVYPRGTNFDELGNPVDDEPQIEQENEEELTLYGTELFANAPSTFSPVNNVPVPANYILGPGDQLVLQLYGKENQEYALQVNRDGNVVIPKLGPVQVATKTFSEAKSFLAAQIKEQVIGVEVNVSMGELRTMRVFVMGEAHKPGAYIVSSLATITHALFVSGGVTDIASLRNIQLKRAGQLITTFDLYDLLNKGDSSKDALLQPGDVVLIPTVDKTVTVDGLVRRPAIYELKTEESLSAVIALAGGKLPEGFAGAIGIRRYIDGVQTQVTAQLDKSDLKIKDGDYITVPPASNVVSNSVTLIGAVARPGKYQWVAGITLRSLIGNVQRDLLEMADLSYVLILRSANQNQEYKALQIDLTDSTVDLAMQPNDKIFVFSKVETHEFGDIKLDELAFTEEELEASDKEKWSNYIDQKLFWRSVGLDGVEEKLYQQEDEESVSDLIIQLSEEEKERLLEFKQATYFSRKRMLTPVIELFQEQAKYGSAVQLVEIDGEVRVPGLYPLTQDATVAELIKAAGGLSESAYPQKSEITRTTLDDMGKASISHIAFSPSKLLTGRAQQGISLQSRDRVNIFTIPSWQKESKVEVRGEVAFPGLYTIRRGETLVQLLARVGGYTEYADPESAVFTRESLKQQEKANIRRLTEELRKEVASESLRAKSASGQLVAYDEARKLLRDLSGAEAIGRLVIDMESLGNDSSHSNITLEHGDTLYVPKLSQSINVIGEVYVPSSHIYEAGLNYEQYIARSGGFRNFADKGKVYIIRGNGSVIIPNQNSSFWFNGASSQAGIRAGDTIVVPYDTDRVDNMTLWTNATQILYQLSVAVAAIGSL